MPSKVNILDLMQNGITIIVVLIAFIFFASKQSIAEQSLSEEDYFKQIAESQSQILPNDWLPKLSNYPEKGSAEESRETSYLQSLVAKRTDEVIKNIKLENEAEFPSDLFENAGLVNLENKPKTKEILIGISQEIAIFVLREKFKYNRARPNVVDKTLSVVVPVPAHPSYPSGHAAQAMAAALVMTEFDKENADKYIQIATTIGRNREVAGLHFSSDTDAGFEFARQAIDAMKRNKNFNKYLDAAKSEFKI